MKEVILSDHSLRPKEYFEQLLLTFPDAYDKDDDMGVHFNMERFADFTIKQVKESNWAKLKDCFDFQEQRIELLNPDLENALNVSYCESILLGGQIKDELLLRTIECMGPLLKQTYQEYEKYYNNLGKASKQMNP